MAAMPGAPWFADEDDTADPRPRRPWRAKFRDALRGLKLGVRGHSSFFVHFFFAALVVAGAVVLQCSLAQWGVLLLCIGLVLTAELFNSAIETLFRGLDEHVKARAWPALDIGLARCCSRASPPPSSAPPSSRTGCCSCSAGCKERRRVRDSGRSSSSLRFPTPI